MRDPYNQLDNDLGKIADQGKKAGKNVAKKVGKNVGKMALKAGKAIGKASVKAVAYAVKAIVATVLPFIGIIAGVLGVVVLAYFILFEFKGSEQQYTNKYENELEQSDDGKYTANNVNQQNNSISSFYKYFSGQSFYQLIGDSKELIKPDDEKSVRDYHNREKNFYLSSNLLYSLDEYLYEGRFKYPEQLVKPVNYDPNTLTLKMLTSEDKMVNVESKELDLETGEETGNKIKSVRDFGLAPIIKYGEYQRTLTIEGEIESREIFDFETKKKVLEKLDKPEAFAPITMKGFPEDIYLIDKVISYVGEFEYTYEYKKTKLKGMDSGTTEDERIDRKGVLYKTITYCRTYSSPDENGNTKCVDEVEVDLYEYRTADTKVMVEMPVGKGNKSVKRGKTYLYDYLYNFESYIPQNVLEEEDLIERIDFSSYVFLTNEVGSYALGSRVGNTDYERAYQLAFPLMQQYAERFDIDPYIILAMSVTESSGDHDGAMEKCLSGKAVACGLMQIEAPGVVVGSMSQVDKNGNTLSIKITGKEDVASLENNIIAGILQFYGRSLAFKENPYLTIQSYNYGVGGMNEVIRRYSEATRKTRDQIIADKDDLGWMAYRYDVHKFPQEWYPSWSYETYGDPIYLEKVLSYYGGTGIEQDVSTENPDTNGETEEENEDGEDENDEDDEDEGEEAGEAEKKPKSFADKMKDFFSSLLPNRDEPEPVTDYIYGINYDNIESMLVVAKIMGNKDYFSNTDNTDTLELWEDGYMDAFISTGISLEEIENLAPMENGYYPPLVMPQSLDRYISSGYGPRVLGGSPEFHKGIDLAVPSGTPILAIAPGKVVKAGCDSKGCDNGGGYMVSIDHGNGLYSWYMHMLAGSITVKVGQQVEAKTVLGGVGSTGRSTGDHLHFELRMGNNSDPIDPTDFVTGTGKTKSSP